jgi:tRNA nucleotidyltransferase (CCA-adding enzyme)
MNALAYNHKTGLIDLFNGCEDIQNRLIKCVGNPVERFTENPLRIMRALRFAATLGFDIDSDTKQALFDNKKRVNYIKYRRIQMEFSQLLVGDNAVPVLREYLHLFAEFIPELDKLAEIQQKHPNHCYNVLEHTLTSINYASKDLILRLTMLFHDIGKTKYHQFVNGRDYFNGHNCASAATASETLSRLKYRKADIKTIKKLIFYHDLKLKPSTVFVKKCLTKISEHYFRLLLQVKYADIMAQSQISKDINLPIIQKIPQLLDQVISQKQCYTLAQLAIKPEDLTTVGLKKKKINNTLQRLLKLVIEEKIENTKEELLKALRTDSVLLTML